MSLIVDIDIAFNRWFLVMYLAIYMETSKKEKETQILCETIIKRKSKENLRKIKQNIMTLYCQSWKYGGTECTVKTHISYHT